MKIALATIVKPTDEEALLLNKMLESSIQYVDKAFITITGNNEKCTEVAKKYNANISYFDWCNDFSKARNFNFSQVTEDYDFILWLDCDDTLIGGENLRKILEFAGLDILILDYEYAFDEFDNCTTKHMKTRVVKNDGCVEWLGTLHEDFHNLRSITPVYNKDIKVKHNTTTERVKVGSDRNLDIALQELENKPNDPRSYWLCANAHNMAGNRDEAKQMYLKFLTLSKSKEEKYLALIFLSDLYKDTDRYQLAKECLFEMFKLKPESPQTWHKLSEFMYKQKKYEQAIEFAKIGLTKKLDEKFALVHNPLDFNYNPYLIIANSSVEIYNDEQALEYYKKAQSIRPTKTLEIIIHGLENGQLDNK